MHTDRFDLVHTDIRWLDLGVKPFSATVFCYFHFIILSYLPRMYQPKENDPDIAEVTPNKIGMTSVFVISIS
jgi:hypothetical protein